jgi:hypothetical protein
MNKIYVLLLIGLSIIACKEKTVEKKLVEEKVEFNQNLTDELKRMEKVDQIAAYIPQGEYTKMSKNEWKSFKDSVFTTHQKRIAEIFNEFGFVGYDLAGKDSSDNFWIIVQHSDHLPKFQQKVLEEMKKQVDKENATPEYYGYLVDRVNINIGKPQVYGTQFDYNQFGQAFPKNTTDTTGINNRRISLGLTPMIERMNEMTLVHFQMNKEYFAKKGITAPKLYKIK